MNQTMNNEEVRLAMRIIGLRGTRMKARGNNGWNFRYKKDLESLNGLETKKLAQKVENTSRWVLTKTGIQQLKLQIGEFILN